MLRQQLSRFDQSQASQDNQVSIEGIKVSKSHLGELVNNLYALLEPHDGDTRSKAMKAVQVLFGEIGEYSAPNHRPEPATGRVSATEDRSNLDLASNAAEYFEQK